MRDLPRGHAEGDGREEVLNAYPLGRQSRHNLGGLPCEFGRTRMVLLRSELSARVPLDRPGARSSRWLRDLDGPAFSDIAGDLLENRNVRFAFDEGAEAVFRESPQDCRRRRRRIDFSQKHAVPRKDVRYRVDRVEPQNFYPRVRTGAVVHAHHFLSNVEHHARPR
jgi:hypothetical protein